MSNVTPLEIVVRPGVPKDAERLAVLGAQVWMHTYATNGVSQVIAEYVLRELSGAAMAVTLNEPTKHVTVAEIAKHLVGYSVLCYSTECPQEPRARVELSTLHVQEHFARQGLGSKLLSHAERLAQREGSSLWLTVNAQNFPAIAFYEAHAYSRVGTAYFELGGERFENHVLTKRGA